MSERAAIVARAVKAINDVFSDRSVSLEEALDRQRELQETVQGNIDALQEDIGSRDL